jgi:site-specific DNA-methyltransferase (adenine-specific)
VSESSSDSSYDYGGRSKRKWPAKHDTIFWYAADPKNYSFNAEAIDRISYVAPSLVGKEKAKRGKVPTDVWWQTIVPTNGKERTGYPTQKPLAILERIVKVHSNSGEVVMDFFAGSGTTGVAAANNDRQFVLVDTNPEAVQVAAKRLTEYGPECVGFTPEPQIV